MSERSIDRLIFVYNAESGLLATIADSAKKLLSINGCALCSLTHSLTGEKQEWNSCKESLGVPVDYVHRDELDARLQIVVQHELPCVLAETDGELVMLLRSDVIKRCNGSIPDFRGRLTTHAAMRGLTIRGDSNVRLRSAAG